MKTEDEQSVGHRAVQLSGAFAFLKGRQFDVVIVVRLMPGDDLRAKQIQIYYSENERVSSFVFDIHDHLYSGSYDLFMAAGIRAVLTEVKSRVLAQEDFLVWYYTDDEQNLIELEAGRFLEQNKTFQRFIDELAARSRIIDLAESNG